MEYTKILKRAVQITWQHKALWVFGFLLALFSAGGGGGQGVGYRMDRTDVAGLQWVWAVLVFVLVMLVVIAVVAIILSNLSRGALVGMVREVEETDHTSVRSGWRMGKSRLGTLIPIDLLTSIPAVIAALLLFALAASPLLLLFATRGPGLARQEAVTALAILLTVLLGLAAIAVIALAGIVLGVVREFACRQAVLEGKGILESIRDGYGMIRASLRHVGVMWLLLFGIDLVAGAIAFPVFLVIFGLAGGLGASVYVATESIATAVVAGLLLGLPGILLLAFASGVYLAFRSTTWTLTYMELQAQA